MHRGREFASASNENRAHSVHAARFHQNAPRCVVSAFCNFVHALSAFLFESAGDLLTMALVVVRLD